MSCQDLGRAKIRSDVQTRDFISHHEVQREFPLLLSDVVQSLVVLDPQKRANLRKLCNHPATWNENEMNMFIRELHEYARPILQMFEKQDDQIQSYTLYVFNTFSTKNNNLKSDTISHVPVTSNYKIIQGKEKETHRSRSQPKICFRYIMLMNYLHPKLFRC